jgi:hypothetical protein
MTIERNNMVAFLEKYKLGPVNNEEFTKDLEMIQLKQVLIYIFYEMLPYYFSL